MSEINHLILARKRAGKSTFARGLIGDLIYKNKYIKNLIVFSPTWGQDATQQETEKKFKGLNIKIYSEISGVGDDLRSVNNMKSLYAYLVNKYKKPTEAQKKCVKLRPLDVLRMHGIHAGHYIDEEKKEIRERELKPDEIDTIIYVDDLATQISDKFLSSIIRSSRHFHCSVIVVSQGIQYVTSTLQCFDKIYLGYGLSESVIEKLEKNLMLDDKNKEKIRENYLTIQPFQWITINTTNDEVTV